MPGARKIAEVSRWFREKVTCKGEPYFLDDEQVAAVVAENRNILVTARAGSGKTRTIVAKIVYLIAYLGYKPNEIIAFVFNKDASKEINSRLKKMCVDGRPVVGKDDIVAVTFHAFAYYVVYSLARDMRGSILMDTEEYAYHEKFIEEIVRTIPAEVIYKFFREMRTMSLGGDYIKTSAEKIIADWLFEHDILYEYDKKYYLNAAMQKVSDKQRGKMKDLVEKTSANYVRAEFYLLEIKKPWKHFLADGYEGLIKQRRFYKKHGDYEKYVEMLEKMQWFFSGKWGRGTGFSGMVESCFDEKWTREECEEYLDTLAERQGFSHEKLPETEIIKRTYEKNLEHFVKMISQFVVRREQGVEVDLDNANEQQKKFYELGEGCYKLYRQKLTESPKFGTDFTLMLMRAKELIEQGVADDFLREKKILMIDEYQDFSRSFLEIVKAILVVRPDAKVFAVGDDWQAINRFAGSDVKYFLDFPEYFPEDVMKLAITTNYRSAIKIVETARDFMVREMSGEGNLRAFSRELGEVKRVAPGILKLNKDEDAAIMQLMKTQAEGKMLKEIVWQIKNFDAETIFLLHRRHKMRAGITIDEFYDKLGKICVAERVMSRAEFDTRVRIMTMHQSKGLEADLVILLENEKEVQTHPDAEYYQIFGEDERTAKDDAVRLMYVAMTRARRKLVILEGE